MEQGRESGGSEPHLFSCSDGVDYLVKVSNNQQNGEVLINETVCGLCLDWIGVQHPATATANIRASLLQVTPGLSGVVLGSETHKVLSHSTIPVLVLH